jgi:hypothetical protein
MRPSPKETAACCPPSISASGATVPLTRPYLPPVTVKSKVWEEEKHVFGWQMPVFMPVFSK